MPAHSRCNEQDCKCMNRRFKTIAIIGMGYIGLPTAAVIASHKINVIGVDVDVNAVNCINQGKIHIIEPGLENIVQEAVAGGYLRATLNPEVADVFLIAVPTPFKSGNNDSYEPDLKFVKAAAISISKVLKKGDLIVLESTCPVGATEKMIEWLEGIRPDLIFPKKTQEDSDIKIAYCPERVLPGRIIKELVENDRVIGGVTNKCAEAAESFYKIFVKGGCIKTNARTAEMCKLTENSFRDVNIAFANELSIICDRLNVNVWELIKLANHHPRVDILKPGPGVGGHCIAVDPWFIVNAAPEHSKIIRSAREVNNNKPAWVVEKFRIALNEMMNKNLKHVENIGVACLGITFKPDIDDLRESPSLEIASEIQKIHNGSIFVVEPNIKKLPKSLESKSKLIDLGTAIKKSHIVIALVAHKDFEKIFQNELEGKIIIDACGLFQWIK